MECKICHAIVTDHAKFCDQCGYKLPLKKICKKCGYELDESSKYCPDCGIKYSNEGTTKEHKV